MREIKALLHDEHLLRFAGLFAIAMAPGWRMRHSEVASVRGRLDQIARIIRGGESFDVAALSAAWVGLITDIVVADKGLSYGKDDLDWFYCQIADQSQARLSIMLLLATASARPRWYTCEQLAELSDKSAVWWRKQAALPDNPWLAQQRGDKTWLFNELILRAHGIEVPQSMQVEVAEDEA